MGQTRRDVTRVLRFIASRGWADEDADVVADLLEQAHDMAVLIVADDGASAEVRSIAKDFLDRLSSDTFGDMP